MTAIRFDRSIEPKSAVTPIIRVGLVACLLFFGGLFAWSWLAPLQGSAVAQGTVVPEGSRRIVQHKEGGIVAEILVKDGDHVEAGATLITIGDAVSGASKQALAHRLIELQATATRFKAEEQGNVIQFSQDLTDRATALGASDVLQAQKAMFDARQSTMASKMELIEGRKEQLKATIKGGQMQVAALQQQLALIEDELVSKQILYQKGYVTKPAILALQRAQAELGGQIGEKTAEIATARQSINDADQQAQDLRKSRLDEIATGMADNGSETSDVKQRLAALDDKITRLAVTAPVSGTVMNLKSKTVGGVVAPGADILEIVPDDEKLLIEAKVAVNDIDRVAIGQDARVVFPAFDQRVTPRLIGTLVEISPDRVEDQQSHQAYFVARISVSDQEIAKLGNEQQVKAGMSGEVFISTGEHSLISWLMKPLFESTRRAFTES